MSLSIHGLGHLFIQHSQELQLWESEDFGRQHSYSVPVQLEYQQGAGDVVKAARLQDADLVITQIPIR